MRYFVTNDVCKSIHKGLDQMRYLREASLGADVYALFDHSVLQAPVEYVFLLHVGDCEDGVRPLFEMQCLTVGTDSGASIDNRTIVKSILDRNTGACILVHNHPPDASISPSTQDIDTTTILLNLLGKIEVNLVDHVIVHSDGYLSIYDYAMWQAARKYGYVLLPTPQVPSPQDHNARNQETASAQYLTMEVL